MIYSVEFKQGRKFRYVARGDMHTEDSAIAYSRKLIMEEGQEGAAVKITGKRLMCEIDDQGTAIRHHLCTDGKVYRTIDKVEG